MATFSFEPRLFLRLNNKEKGVIAPYKGSKNNKGLIPVSQQYFYELTTCEFSYAVTFVRKVCLTDKKIPVLKRRKTAYSHHQTRGLRAFDTVRETYKVEFVREIEYLDNPPQINQVVKRGVPQLDWIVEGVNIVAKPDTSITVEEVSSQRLYKGHLAGGRLITSVKEHISPVNKIISKLCRIQNKGEACSSGQKLQSQTVKTCHASREKNQPQILAQAMFAQCKYPYQRNKFDELREQGALQRGDYTEHCEFDAKGNFLYRDLTIARDTHHKGWQEHGGEFKTIQLGVSEQYKPISLPSHYKESETQDKLDAPVNIDLSAAEKKLKAMGFL